MTASDQDPDDRAGRRDDEQPEAAGTDGIDPTEPLAPAGGGNGGGEPPHRRLTRSRSDRLIGGVCGGLARYFDVDPVIVRIGTVALTALGGLGVIAYLAALLLVPSETDGAPAAPRSTAGRIATGAGVVVLVLVALALLSGAGFFLGGVLAPLAVLGLGGLAAWWLASGRRPGGSAGDVALQSAIGVALLIACGVLFLAAGWAAAVGADGVDVALIAAGVAGVIAGIVVRRARWLVLPAVALLIPAAFITAVGIDASGGTGERSYRPGTAAEVRDRYELGAGKLVVDLRDADLPPGDRPLHLDLGVGHAVVLVPENVCVATRARVGAGEVAVFDRESGGLDVDWESSARAPEGTARVVLDADVDVGAVEVAHREYRHDWDRADWSDDEDDEDRWDRRDREPGNTACA